MSRIAIGPETDFPTNETFETTQGRIVARLPRIPDLKRRLSLIHVASPFHSVFSVNLMTTVSAIAADNAVKTGLDGGHRVFRFAEDPHLEHVAGFPVVGCMGEARGDGHPGVILMEDESVQREPPTINSAKQ